MPHDSIDLDFGGLFTAWYVDHRWCLRLHPSHLEAIEHAQSLEALHIAHPVYIGNMPNMTARVSPLHPDENPEGP